MSEVLTSTYNHGLVLLSLFVAVFASYTALDLANQVTQSRGRTRFVWLASGAVAMGFGIWSMHFVGMLAFHLSQPIAYKVPLLLLSIVFPVLASGLALRTVSREQVTRTSLLFGGSLMGVAIIGMHYCGMAALHTDAHLSYHGTWVVLSVLIAFLASFSALGLAIRFRHAGGMTALVGKVGGAIAMGVGIAGMHYSAMAAVHFTMHSTTPVVPTGTLLATDTLGAGVVLATVVLLALTLVSGAVTRRRKGAQAEAETLREAEKHFRLLAETLPAIVWTSQPDGTTDFYNRRWFDYTGLLPAKTKGWDWQEVVHPDDRLRVGNAWTRASETENDYEAEYRLRRADGTYCWHLGRATPQRDESGRIVKWFGSATNIHDQKQALLDLEQRNEQQALLSRLGEQALKGLSVQQLMTELTTQVRRVMRVDLCDVIRRVADEHVLVLEASAGLDTALLDNLSVDLSRNFLGSYTLLQDAPVVVEDAATETRFEPVPVLAAYGITSSLSVVIHGPRGPYGVLAVHSRDRRSFDQDDIHFVQTVANLVGEAATRAQTVEALQRSEQRYRSLVDATTAVVWRASASGEASSPMSSWCAFTGQQQEDCQGWGWLEAVHPDDREMTAQTWREAVQNRHVYELEHRLRRHDGTYRIMAVRGAPVTGEDGDIIEWVGTHTDITEQRRAEDERRKFELEKVVANQVTNERRRIARDLHDGIRQQLVGIKMLSGNLYKKLLAKEAPEAQLVLEFSNLISDANLEVRQLINGLVPAEIDKDSLPQALRRAAANIEQWYGVSCIVASDGQIVLRDAYTANHLLHLASEAMTNAARHARATQVNVSLALAEGSLRLEVHDDGIGVPEQFDKIGGTGISSMRNRAELIGACFGIESREGRGTKVTCTLRDVAVPATQAHLDTSSPVTARFGP